MTSSVLLVTASVVVAFLVASQVTGKLKETLHSAAITLIFAALVGGLVKILLEDFQRGREQRAEQARFVSAVLADLKSVYDRVERARIVISAHRSAKTYGEEMRGTLIDARVQLRNVGRAVEARTSGITPMREERICAAVRAMETYLARLTDEFQSTYKQISDAQRIHEARVQQKLLEAAEPDELPANEPWARLQGLPHLSDFLAANDYRAEFVAALDSASLDLREELRTLLDVRAPILNDADGRRPAKEEDAAKAAR